MGIFLNLSFKIGGLILYELKRISLFWVIKPTNKHLKNHKT